MHTLQKDRRVRVERQTSGADSFTDQAWVLVAEIWGSVLPVRSSEPRLADAQQSVLTHTLAVNWSFALADTQQVAQWRVVFNDRGRERTMAIVGPGREVRTAGNWLIFDCVEGLADGH